MAFVFLKIILFERNKKHINYALFSRFCLLINYSHQSEFAHHNIGVRERLKGPYFVGKICLYGFDSVFSQVLTDFLFVVSICCSFCNAQTNWVNRGHKAILERRIDHNNVGCFHLLSNGFSYFKLIVLKKHMPIFLTLLFYSFFV